MLKLVAPKGTATLRIGTVPERVGDVKGVDLYLKEDLGDRFFGWITYSLSKSERQHLPSDSWSLYQYDQPNIVNLVASYGINTNWILGAQPIIFRWPFVCADAST